MFSPGTAAPKTPGRSGRGASPRAPKRKPGEGPWILQHPFLSMLALVILGAAYYAFWGSAFRITNIEFVGATDSTKETLSAALDEYVNSKTLLVFPRNNVLVFGEETAKAAIEDAVYLESIDIRKKLPDTLIIDVKEKLMLAVLEDSGRLYAVDDSGFVLRELTGSERVQMPDLPPTFGAISTEGLGAQMVDLTKPVESVDVSTTTEEPPSKNTAPKADAEPELPKNAWPLLLGKQPAAPAEGEAPVATTKEKVEPGAKVFNADTVSTVLQANARLSDIAGEGVRWFTPDDSSDTVDATMATGWHIFLATTSPFEVQSERLTIVLREKINDRRDQLEYVDLRYNERIFLRFKDDAPAGQTGGQ